MTTRANSVKSLKLKPGWASPISGTTRSGPAKSMGQLKGLKALTRPLDDVVKSGADLPGMLELAEADDSFAAEVRGEIQRLETALDELELQSLLCGPHDSLGALVSINARDGGTDANDWAEMLLRMYTLWAQKTRLRRHPAGTAGRRGRRHSERRGRDSRTDGLWLLEGGNGASTAWCGSARSTPKASGRRALPPSMSRQKSARKPRLRSIGTRTCVRRRCGPAVRAVSTSTKLKVRFASRTTKRASM